MADKPIPTVLPAAGASRQHRDSTAFTTIGPSYEHRRIVLAYGVEFHKDEIVDACVFDKYIADRLSKFPKVEKVSRTEYINHAQKVRFTIEETNDKTEFMNYLKTPGIHVIYSGHARFGKGPCFGWNYGDDFEEGTNPASTGIFRMGFPYIGIPVGEIIEHGYHANLVKASEGIPKSADCHPFLRPYLYLPKLKAKAPEEILPGLSSYLRGHTTGDRYWMYGVTVNGKVITHVIHHAGWKNTLSRPFEIGVFDEIGGSGLHLMQCRVFCHFGCSSYIHNYPVVRFLAKWQRQGNERYAYWTTATSYPGMDGCAACWIFSLITYDKKNAFESWKGSIDYALGKTKNALALSGFHFTVK